jgi:predicted oxidoreductase
MQTTSLGVSPLSVSRVAYGCWRIAGVRNPTDITTFHRAAAQQALIAAYESGYTLFDNADVYCGGESERLLGAALKEVSGMRERVMITTKCGVRHAGDPTPDAVHRWDFSREHIVMSCEQSLKRLGVDAIDLYLLHRPDFLANPEEIAAAFTELKDAGKVRFFGVSNFRPTLLTAIQVVCPMPIIAHQMEISLAKLDAFTDGTLDQCLIERVTPMAWSPLAGGLIGEGAKRLLPLQQSYRPEKFLDTLDSIASSRGISRVTVAIAWLLKHPSRIVPVIGSTHPQRIREAVRSVDIDLTRDEWYRLLAAARGEPLP